MIPLTSARRRALRATAHALDPVVTIGQHGLTPAVLHEIDVALLAHELIKIRVFADARAEREALLIRICAELDAAAVQHIGKLLVVWRPAPEPEPVAPRPAARRGDRGQGRTARGSSVPPKSRAIAAATGGRRRVPAAQAPRRGRSPPGNQGEPGAPTPRRARRRRAP